MSSEMRVGSGYDIHQLCENRPLLIGGVRIPHSQGLLGHSDADVLLHAICDGLLGAAGLGDIGEWFPDTDIRYKDACSRELLIAVDELIRSRQWNVVNIDCIVFAQVVRLSPHKAAIRRSIADILRIEESQVNVKAKTMEHLDAVGDGRAIAASCVVLVHRTGNA